MWISIQKYHFVSGIILSFAFILASHSASSQEVETPQQPVATLPQQKRTVQHSDEVRFASVGHNVTQTANLFPKNRCTVGTLIAGCGVTDQFTLGTSPFLLTFYNMANVLTRIQLRKERDYLSALQFGYFKTFPTGEQYPEESNPTSKIYDPNHCSVNGDCMKGYQMEAAWAYWMHTYRVTPEYDFHWNLQAAYYWDDTKPFSLRRPQIRKNPWQVNASFLNEVHLVRHWYMQGEFGVLGLTEKYPSLHSAVTMGYRNHSWAYQIGASATGTPISYFRPGRTDFHSYALAYSREGLRQQFTDAQLQRDFSVHPELYVQFVFDI